MKKRFAFMRLLQPSNSKTAKRKRASCYSWKKRGKKKKKEEKRSKGQLELHGSVAVSGQSAGMMVVHRVIHPSGHYGYLSRGTQYSE